MGDSGVLTGAEREHVMKTFLLFGAMPEDVPVPTEFFDILATSPLIRGAIFPMLSHRLF